MPLHISYKGDGTYSVRRDNGETHPISIDDLTYLGSHLVKIERPSNGKPRPVAFEAAEKLAKLYHADYFLMDTISSYIYKLGGYLEDFGNPMCVRLYKENN